MRGLSLAAHELLLFAGFAFLIGGLSDALIDAIWLARGTWRGLIVFRHRARTTVRTLAASATPGPIAIFIPAWDESAVIGAMLRHALVAVGSADCLIYVGVYPNDPATIAAASSSDDPRVRIVVGIDDGPTTKAACLNTLWQQMAIDETAEGRIIKAVVLHDAEDVVHRDELRIFDSLIDRFDLVQLPVLPLVDRGSRWVSGHYIDEFATHHSRTLIAREWIGAAIPSAGVGCAFRRVTLDRIAQGRDGPFDAASLTEDYELGLRIRALGGRAAFVRLPESPVGDPVCVRAHFPATLSDAVKQKSRWIAGIALSGWDRLGWQGGWAERWMRGQDRRAVIAAVVLLAAYAGLVLLAIVQTVASVSGIDATHDVSPAFSLLLLIGALFLVWRLGLRAILVARLYGWQEGLRSIPRAVLANIIDMMAARRAVGVYLRARRDGHVRWDKTGHHFPADPAAAR